MVNMNKIRSAEILCVGTEILLGQIINTNAAWLARELSLTGIHSYYQTVVGDNSARLITMLELAAGRSDLIIMTGGLGPTQDDLTMATVATFAGRPLLLHADCRASIETYFKKMGRTNVSDNNWKQAMMPEGAHVLPNRNGTAPGAILEITRPDNRVVSLVMLPGPPSEMQPMFIDSVKPYLQNKSSTTLRHCFVRLIGIGESAAEMRLLDLINNQKNPTIAPYASEGEVMFRITQSVDNPEELDLTESLLQEVKDRLGAYIYEVGNRTLPEVVKDLMAAKGLTLSIAESCTGGLVSAAITDFPGASAVLAGSIIAYDNRIKQSHLNVAEKLIREQGVVSQDCAIAMAIGCRDTFNTDFALAVTGIAGPDGGSEDRPVGLVWLAVSCPAGTVSKQIMVNGNRSRVRRVAVLQALDLLRRQVLA